MSDENKTIFVFDGDASGAKRAAQEAAAAVRSQAAALDELAAAEKAAGAAAEEHARKVDLQNKVRSRTRGSAGVDITGGAIPSDPGNAGGKAAEQFDKIGAAAKNAGEQSKNAFSSGKASAEQYGRVLSMLNPQVGGLVGGLQAFQNVFNVGIGKAAVLAGSVAAIAAGVSVVAQTIMEAARKAKETLEELDRADEKLRSRRAGVGEQLALHGIGDEASRGVAAGYVEKLVNQGINQSAAEATAAAVVAAKRAGATVNNEQMLDLATLQQQGAADLTKGTNAYGTSENVSSALAKLNKLSAADRQSLAAAEEQRARTRAETIGSITSGNESQAKKFLIDELGYDEQKAAERAPLLIDAAKGKALPVTETNAVGYNQELIEGTPGYERVKALNDEMVRRFKAARDDSDEAMRRASGRTESTFASPTEARYDARHQQEKIDRGQAEESTWSSKFDGKSNHNAMTQQNRIDQATRMPTPAVDPEKQNKPQQITIHNHYTGINYLNPNDPRGKMGTRAPVK